MGYAKSHLARSFSYLLLALLLVGLGGLSITPSWADPQGRLRQKKEELEGERRRLEVINERERDLARQLNNTQADLQLSREAYQEAIASLQKAKTRLANIQTRLKTATVQYKNSQRVLGKRLREIYMHGDVGYLVVLLGAQSFSDFIDQAHFLSLIIAQDQQLLEQVHALKEELETKRVQAEYTVREIADLTQAQANRVAQLEGIEAKRSQLLADTRRQRDSLSSHVSELENSTLALEDEIQRTISYNQIMTGPTSQRAGSRVWGTGPYLTPTQGPITSPFGYRVHPIFGTLRFHTGIDIGAYSGDPILAADSGVVIDAGWMGGYGNCLIIDHGGGYSTLYAHCSQLFVTYGQGVTKGQQVAAVGSTGNSTGPHLHFEVRINGEPVDPLGFI